MFEWHRGNKKILNLELPDGTLSSVDVRDFLKASWSISKSQLITVVSVLVKVRWADLEEQKDADRKRAIGFVVGQTDWARITDESGQLAQKALNRTKYF